ncbi:hypothetical protein CPB85DRAFT_456088 [Mucidula mucida]|nr:hypothetical protein CPB85DRAFT_456088 [Mucidula mucida]
MTVHISMNELCWFVDFVDFGPLLRESTSRWVDCRLYTSFEFVDDILSDCNFDSLISLCLELYPDSSADIAPQAKKLDAFINTPLLRSLDYRNEFHQEYPVLLPWGQLTSMEVAAPALSDAFALGPFKTLTNVQRLTLHLSSLDLETDTLLFLSHNPLQLPSLTSLCLSRLAEEDAQTGQFISCLEMPAFTELELVFEWLPSTDSEDDEDVASRITFPHFHSSVDLGQLKILSITFPYEDDPDGVDKLVAFLCLVPNLHELWLCHYDIPSAVFDALTLKNGHSEILPYLQLLNFSGSGFAGDVGITHVLSMLESRCPLPGRETNGPSVLTQFILFPYAVQHIATMCVNDEIRGRWDDLCTSMLVISR